MRQDRLNRQFENDVKKYRLEFYTFEDLEFIQILREVMADYVKDELTEQIWAN